MISYTSYHGSGQNTTGLSGDPDYNSVYGRGGDRGSSGGSGYAVVYLW